MQSPGFSQFRDLMDLWDTSLFEEDLENKVNAMINNHGCILFFKKDGQIFGAPEESRMVFARMKNPDENDSDGWESEASFSAFNLSKEIESGPSQNVFTMKDLNKIEVLDEETASKELNTSAKKLGDKAFARSSRLMSFSDFLNQRNQDQGHLLRTDEK